jgi:hypothetical protein
MSKYYNNLDVFGDVSVTGGVKRPGGSNKEVFLADGTVGTYSGPAAQPDGWIYFNAAYKSGLTFSVTGEYILGGTLYTLRQTDLTVTADPTDPVIHVLGGDDSGNLIVISGTPSPTPSKPAVDPVTQLEGTFVTVSAGATTPDGVTETSIYYENQGTAGGEWNSAVSGGTIITNGTAINGAVAIEGTNSVSGNRVTFTPSGDIDLEATPITHLNYLIQNKAAVNGKADTHRFLANGLDGAGNPVSIALMADPNYDLSSTTAQFLSLSFPDFTNIKTLQNIEFVINAKSAFGFYLDDIRLVESDQEMILDKYALLEYVDARDNYILSLLTGAIQFVADEASRPGTGETGVLYIASAENSMWEWNGSSYDQLGGGGAPPALTQAVLTDASTISWNIGTDPIALLTATSGVGNTRTIPNTVIDNGADGNNYQLTFVQDGTGGRNITFGSNFNVVGQFDLAPNRRTLVTMVVQGTEADVILSPVIDPEKPESLTGTNLDMSKYFGNTYNYDTPSTAVSYTTFNPVINGFVRAFVNASTEPIVYETDGTTPATKVGGNIFQASTTMEMIVDSPDGVSIEYYFLSRA